TIGWLLLYVASGFKSHLNSHQLSDAIRRTSLVVGPVVVAGCTGLFARFLSDGPLAHRRAIAVVVGASGGLGALTVLIANPDGAILAYVHWGLVCLAACSVVARLLYALRSGEARPT